MVPLTYKIATEASEFEAIHRLNYDTFVEEIPQHTANPERRLVDRFHAQNTYVICLDGPPDGRDGLRPMRASFFTGSKGRESRSLSAAASPGRGNTTVGHRPGVPQNNCVRGPHRLFVRALQGAGL